MSERRAGLIQGVLAYGLWGIRVAMRDFRLVATMAASSALLALNWGVFRRMPWLAS